MSINPPPWYWGLDIRVAYKLLENGYSSRDQVYKAVISKELTDNPTPEQRAKHKYINQTTIPGLGFIGFRTLLRWLSLEKEI